MAIKRQDVQLLESERLTDEPDGGGRMTGTEVPDGEVNNLFPDVSRLDRTYGRVNLRKAFAAIRTTGTETYYGCHLAVAKQPQDENVSVLLFDTGDHDDERENARFRIEAYLTPDAPYDVSMQGKHLNGQRSLSLTAPLDAPTPSVGETFQLANDNQDEFNRVAGIEVAEEEVFNGTTYETLQVIDINLARPLELDWDPGSQDIEFRSTTVADAARYYGGTSLANAVSAGDTQVQLDSIYAPIVPATESEEPVSDKRGARPARVTVDSGGNTVEFPAPNISLFLEVTQETRGQNWSAYLLPLPEPGTIRVSWLGLGTWMTLKDDGDGGLEGDGGGSVDYTTGSINFSTSELPDAPSRIILEWNTPAHYRDGSGTVDQRPPTLTREVEDKILPGTLALEWSSGGATKTASDDGSGNITGDADGRVAYGAGQFTIKPTAWPDPNGTVTATYDVDDEYTETLANGVDESTFTTSDTLSITVSNTPIRPGTIRMTWWVKRTEEWAVSSTEKSTGDREWDWSTALSWGSYTKSTKEWDNYSESGSTINEIKKEAVDDGSGGMEGAAIDATVDYANGTITFKPTAPYSYEAYGQSSKAGWNAEDHVKSDYTEKTTTENRSEEEELIDAPVTVEYTVDDTTNVQASEVTLDVPPIVLTLKPDRAEQIIAGTVRFTWGDTFYDYQGKIFRESDDLEAGTIGYERGEVEITAAISASTDTVEIHQMVTSATKRGEGQIFFRTPGAPVRPGSVSISATTTTGETIAVTSDSNNKFDGPNVKGTLHPETGTVELTFGYLTDLSAIDTENPPPWYDSNYDTPDGTQTWRPLQVLPESLRYSATIIQYLPLEADILGLDPIRLPQDGRVPIFRAADVALFADPQTTELAEGASAGDEYTLPRGDLGYIELRDYHDEPVDPVMYDTDLDAGTVTLTSDFDVSGYTEPLKALHRKEEMVLISEVQVTGQVTLSRSLNRSFPEGAQVASAMIVGDMRARVSNLFTEKSWDGSWYDERQGDGTTATYDNINYPIEVTNSGAVPERWAIEFTSTTEFRVIGENRGEIATGDTSTDTAPTNPATGETYFSIRAEGWGTGWSAGNVLRFNTHGANHPVWMARTVLAGETAIEEDQFVLQIRGDAQ